MDCSTTATLTTMIELPQFIDSSFQIDGNNIDCANGEEGRSNVSEFSFSSSEVGVQVSSSGSNFNYFVNWDNPAAGSISIPINQAGSV